ncbi:hypothetical protein LTR86_011028 [Recurvomyces mirabilis]|nr:hypothetical protein LTR86_011028 [Recurvomyces mirabilis]
MSVSISTLIGLHILTFIIQIPKYSGIVVTASTVCNEICTSLGLIHLLIARRTTVFTTITTRTTDNSRTNGFASNRIAFMHSIVWGVRIISTIVTAIVGGFYLHTFWSPMSRAVVFTQQINLLLGIILTRGFGAVSAARVYSRTKRRDPGRLSLHDFATGPLRGATRDTNDLNSTRTLIARTGSVSSNVPTVIASLAPSNTLESASKACSLDACNKCSGDRVDPPGPTTTNPKIKEFTIVRISDIHLTQLQSINLKPLDVLCISELADESFEIVVHQTYRDPLVALLRDDLPDATIDPDYDPLRLANNLSIMALDAEREKAKLEFWKRAGYMTEEGELAAAAFYKHQVEMAGKRMNSFERCDIGLGP